jgi:hypothetical protein
MNYRPIHNAGQHVFIFLQCNYTRWFSSIIHCQQPTDINGIIDHIVLKLLPSLILIFYLKTNLIEHFVVGSVESLQSLHDLEMLGEFDQAAVNSPASISKTAEYDSVTRAAAFGSATDSDLTLFSRMAPENYTAGQKVRYMELMAAASIPGTFIL